ncbi:MAG: carotenoid biosynthesis protein [Clostridia bacterium]|nr:carotenoid biosynthesis protein [Clostridia bacterium]
MELANYPVTWIIMEVMSVVLFAMCMRHALNSDRPKHKIFELCCFVLAAALFEHVGVLGGNYWYSQERFMRFGLLPLSILLIESVIMYSAMTLFEYTNMPKWSIIWFVGILSTLQDMTIDPVYVNDRYVFDGVAQGHWNWTIYYDTTFFGIPFFNFSSWFFMTGIYAGLMMLGRRIYEKTKKEWIGVAYPFVSAVLLIIALVPTAILLVKPVYSDNNTFKFWYELIALIFNFACAIVLIAKNWKKMSPVNLRKDGIVIFAIPAILHLYDIIVGFGLGIKQSYIPVVVFTVIHMAYLAVVYRKSKKAIAK